MYKHLLLSLTLLFAVSRPYAMATTYTWNGSSSGLWLNLANWSALPTAPLTDDELVFPSNATTKSMDNDLGLGIDLRRLTFSGSGYTLIGDRLDLSSTVADAPLVRATHASGTTQLNLPFNLLESSSFTSVAGGKLALLANADIALSSHTLTLAAGGAIDVGGTISGTGGVTISGSGLVRFDVAQTFTGATSVTDGELRVASTMSSSGITVSGGAVLSGIGTTPAVTASGGISPGDGGRGRLTIGGALAFSGAAGGELTLELGAATTAGTTYDQLTCQGTVALSSLFTSLNLVSVSGFTPSVGQVYTLLDKSGASKATGTFQGLPEGAILTLGTKRLQISYSGGTGNDVTATVVNTLPTITGLSAQTINEDANTGALAFTVGDTETAAGSLTLSAASSNTALVPVSGIAFGGSGASRTVTVTPAANQSGASTVTLTLSDGADTAVTSFLVTVTAVNDPPTITAISDRSTPEDTTTAAIAFTIGDAETSASALAVTVSSSNTTLVPNANIVINGTGASRELLVTPAPDLSGSSTITVQVGDGTVAVTEIFLLTVTAVNDMPAISAIGDPAVNEDTGTGAIAFTVGDVETAAASLVVTRGSSNTALLPLGNIVLGGSGANRTVAVTPGLNQSGSALVTLTVTDANGGSAVEDFLVTVSPVNDAPTISAITDITINEDGSTGAVNFTINDVDHAVASLTIGAGSSNPALVPAPVITGTGISRGMTLNPLPDQHGTATISVTVSDGLITTEETFILTVVPANDPPGVTNIANQTIPEDGSTGTLAFTISDVETGAGSLTITASSSNTAIIPAANIVIGGSGASRTVAVTPAANVSGLAFVDLFVSDGTNTTPESFSVTVTSVNDAPAFVKGADVTVAEGAGPQFFNGWATGISKGAPDESTQTLAFSVVGNTNPALFSAGPVVSGTGGSLSFTPAADANGSATITLALTDNGGTANGGSDTSATQDFVITVTPVNDRPSFVRGANQTVLEDCGPQTVSAWATSISPGPANEAGQALAFVIIGNTNTALFATGPAIAPDGTLTYTPAPNANGSAIITLTLQDDGGTANGGADTSVADSFNITVTGVNDAPGFTKGADVTVLEDSGTHTISGWATNLSGGPADESQSLSFEITGNTNPTLFGSGPTVNGSGQLSFQTSFNANGSAVITLRARDNGDTDNGGTNTSPTQSFLITFTPVNDRPTFSAGFAQSAQEDDSPQTAVGWASNMSPGPADEAGQTLQFVIVSNSNPSMFSAAPAIANDGTLTWTPAPDANGVASIGVQLTDNGGTDNGGLDSTITATFQIQVSPVNDAPSFVKGADITLLEDAGSQVIAGWASAINPGVPNESGQTLTFTVVGVSGTLGFLSPPAVAADGTLSFTTAANAVGSSTFEISLSDGEASTTTQSFVITATPVNDAPTFTVGPNQTHGEGTQLRTVVGWISGASVGPPDEAAQTRSFEIVSNSNPGLFVTQPSVTPTATLSYSIGFGLNGSAVVGVRMHDNGGTADGGVNVSPTQNFTITVNSVNSQPTFTGGPSVTVNEDAGAQSIPNWATNISTGPPDEAGQTITFLFTFNFITPPDLFVAGPSVSADGTLSFTPAPNAFGVANLVVVAKDNGGANPGLDTSPSHSFNITVNAVNDPPEVAAQSHTIPKNARLPLTLMSTDFEGNPRTLSIVTPPAHGTLSEFISPSGPLGPMNLIYTPDAGYTGTDSFTYRATDADPGLPATVSVTITEPPAATGITRVWDGGAGTSSWVDAANWVDDEAPQTGDSLSFPDGAAGVANTTNDLPARFVLDEIILGADQTVSGNSLALLGGIQSAKGVNWSVALDFLAPGHLHALPSGASNSFLAINSEINIGPFPLELEATDATLSTRRRILGTGGVTTTGNVSMENSSTIAGAFTGGITVESGDLKLIRQIIGQRTVAAGPVEVKSGAFLYIDSVTSQSTFSPLDETSSLTLREDAVLIVDGHPGTSQRIASLFIEGGIISVAANNNLKISGDITASGTALSRIGTGSPSASIVFDGPALEHVIHVPTDSQLRVDSNSLIFSEALVRKTGGGTLDLNGNTQLTGGLSIDEGLTRFFADSNTGGFGSDAQLTPVLLNGGSVSGNSHPISQFARRTGTITSGTGGGTLSPNTDLREMRTLSLALNAATTFRTEFIDSQVSPSRRFDLTLVQGAINLGGAAFELVRPAGFVPPADESIVIIENDGNDAITGTFAGMPEGHTTTVGNVTYRVSYVGGDGNDVALFFNVLPTGITRVWDGGGSGNNWSDAANWDGDNAPQPGDTLEFPSPSPRMTPFNDYPIDSSFHQIRIVGTGPRYEMHGNPLRLSGGIFTSGENTSFPQHDNFLIQVRSLSDQSIIKSGARRFNSSTWDTAGHVLTLNDQVAGIDPVNTANPGIQVYIGGTGDVVIEGPGSSRADNGLPIHSGTVEVRSGTLVITESSGNHRTGPMLVGGFGQPARLLSVGIVAQLETVPTTIRSQGVWEHTSHPPSFPNVFQPAANVTLDGGSMIAGSNARFTLHGTLTVPAGRSASLTGRFMAAALNGGPVTIDVQAGATLTHADPDGELGSNSGSYFVKTGPGLWHCPCPITAPRMDLTGGVTRIDGNANTTLIRLSGGTIGGTGSVGDITSIGGGGIAPGASTGILSSGAVSWNGGTSYHAEISGATAGSLHDQLAVTGTVDLGGAVLAPTIGSGFAAAGQEIILINNDGGDSVAGGFSGLAEGATVSIGDKDFVISYSGGDGNDVSLTASGTPLPPVFAVTSLTLPATGGGNADGIVSGGVSNATPGLTAILQASSDLATWTPLASQTVDSNGNATFTNIVDTGSGANPEARVRRFFRIIVSEPPTP